MKKIIVTLLIFFITTGCSNYREMNNLGIVSAFGIQIKDDKFLTTAQLINVNNKTETVANQSPIYLISAEGETVFESIRNMHKKSAKSLFFAHTKIVIIDKTILENKEYLDSFIDLLARDMEMSLSFFIITCNEVSINDILSTLSLVESFTAVDLENTIKNSLKRSGTGYELISKDFFSKYLSPGINNVYTNINITKNKNEKNNISILEIANAEIFTYVDGLLSFDKEGNMIYINDEYSKTLNIIQNNVKNINYTIECGNEIFTIETQFIDFGFKEDLKNNKIKVEGKILTAIAEYNCEYDLNKNQDLKKIKNLISNRLESDIKDLIKFAQENQNDFIGIGKYIYKNNPKYFDFKNKSWDKEGFPVLNYDVKVDVNLYKQGNLKGTVKHEK